MTINAVGKFVGSLFIITLEPKGKSAPSVRKNLEKQSWPNLLTRRSKLGQSRKKLSVEKLKENSGIENTILVLD